MYNISHDVNINDEDHVALPPWLCDYWHVKYGDNCIQVSPIDDDDNNVCCVSKDDKCNVEIVVECGDDCVKYMNNNNHLWYNVVIGVNYLMPLFDDGHVYVCRTVAHSKQSEYPLVWFQHKELGGGVRVRLRPIRGPFYSSPVFSLSNTGLDTIMAVILNTVAMNDRCGDIVVTIGGRTHRKLLVCGAKQCGKTSLLHSFVHSICKNVTIATTVLHIDGVSDDAWLLCHDDDQQTQWDDRCGNVYKRIRQWYLEYALSKRLQSSTRIVIVIDDFECLCSGKQQQQRQKFISLIEDILCVSPRNVLVCTSSLSKDTVVDSKVSSLMIQFDQVYSVSRPNEQQRFAICMELWKARYDSSPPTALVRRLSEITPGFVTGDLERVFMIADVHWNFNENFDLDKVWSEVRSSVRRVTATLPSNLCSLYTYDKDYGSVSWNRISGYHEIKRQLVAILDSWQHPQQNALLGGKASRGIMLHGPSGCGKSRIAHALGTHGGFNFLVVNASDILSLYVGESERALRNVFSEARDIAPSIVFMDEVDSLGRRRDESQEHGGSVSERILSTLLNEMDGIDSNAMADVHVIGATNRLELVDDALLRPGRFDHLIHVSLPSHECRVEIWKDLANNVPTDEMMDCERLASLCDGMSGADIHKYWKTACLASIRDNCDTISFQRVLECFVPTKTS